MPSNSKVPTGRKTLREYETTFIVQPEISDEGSQTILSKLDGVLETGGAVRLMCEDHGKRKLAYEVRKFHKGHYFTLMFLDEGSVVPDLERTLRLEESVLRFLTIQANDEVADIDARKSEAAEAEERRPNELKNGPFARPKRPLRAEKRKRPSARRVCARRKRPRWQKLPPQNRRPRQKARQLGKRPLRRRRPKRPRHRLTSRLHPRPRPKPMNRLRPSPRRRSHE
jgi:small subunit ribosomal protein S6